MRSFSYVGKVKYLQAAIAASIALGVSTDYHPKLNREESTKELIVNVVHETAEKLAL
jgi:arginine utilization protein RocB